MNAITISPEAWIKIHEKLILTESKTVRIGIKTTGCNGYSYTFTTTNDQPTEDDDYLQEYDHFVSVDQEAVPLIQGSELRWDGDDVFSKHFAFVNPNAKDECGCGESFSV